MLQDFLVFFSFQNGNINAVLLSVVLLGLVSGMVGSFNYLKKKALVGETVAHAMLPGIAFAFLLSGVKDPFFLLIGAIVSGWLSIVSVDFITNKSIIKSDTALAIVLTVFFGGGMMVSTYIQQSGNFQQAGLDEYIFGQAAAMTQADVRVFGMVAIFVLIVVVFFFKAFQIASFNRDYAAVLGLPVRWFDFMLSTLTILTIAAGIKAVGIILMSALLIAPAATARFWTNDLRRMMVLAGIIGALSGVVGAYVSFTAKAMPTGPWTVVALTGFALVSVFFAPEKGILSKWNTQRRNRNKILCENILKMAYQLGEVDGNFKGPRDLASISQIRRIPENQWHRGLELIQAKGYGTAVDGRLIISFTGKEKGKEINRLHRLWEVYLARKMKLRPELVHKDAEAIEHIITPELEKDILAELNLCDNFEPMREIHATKPIVL
jgi:manganese/zinc/iron transport system permease protein